MPVKSLLSQDLLSQLRLLAIIILHLLTNKLGNKVVVSTIFFHTLLNTKTDSTTQLRQR